MSNQAPAGKSFRMKQESVGIEMESKAWAAVRLATDSVVKVMRLVCPAGYGFGRQRAEQAMKESGKRFHNLLETVHLVAIILDEQGTLTFCIER